MLEKPIERAVCDYAKSKGWMEEKFSSPAKGAVPDRLFTHSSGYMFFIEFKATGKKTTVPQARDHEKRRAMNVRVDVVDSIEQGKRVIDEVSTKLELPQWLR